MLLIMGATASMLWWPDEFCAALAGQGRFVIRYDNRDTGQSSTAPLGAPDYGMDEMAGDALAILDAYGIARADLVGMSLGGMVAQIAALRAPERVASLTLISTAAFDEDDSDLPQMDPAFLAHFSTVGDLDWSDRAAVVTFHAEGFRLSAGGRPDFDMDRARDLAGREYDHARNPQSALNHGMIDSGTAWAGRMRGITAPALVIHGRHDPILSFEHGQRLAAKLRDARFLALDAGHELDPKDRPRMLAAIADLTTSGL